MAVGAGGESEEEGCWCWGGGGRCYWGEAGGEDAEELGEGLGFHCLVNGGGFGVGRWDVNVEAASRQALR